MAFPGFRTSSCFFLLSVFTAAGLILFCPGCSDAPAPPPPKVYPELLTEIFDSARMNRHDNAVGKIQRLRTIDQTSVFLPELETIERTNSVMTKINALAASCKFREALALLDESERKNGADRSSKTVRSLLNELVRLHFLLGRLKSGKCTASREQRASVLELDAVSKNLIFSSKLRNFVEKQRSLINVFDAREKDRAVFGVCSDAETLMASGDIGGPALMAVAETLLPDGRGEIAALNRRLWDFKPAPRNRGF